MLQRVPKAGIVELPKDWPELVGQALVSALSLSWVSFTYVTGWALDSPIARLKLKGENARLLAKCGALKEELRIKDARMLRIDAKHRPHYSPEERLSILALKAGQGLNAAQTARRFLLTAGTIAEWMRLLESGGEQRLLRLRTPVNKFSEFVELVVQQLRATVPLMGRRKLAEVFARAGLHLSASTVRRFGKKPPRRPPLPAAPKSTESKKVNTEFPKIVAKHPGHVWNCDLTACPISGGFWIAWLPRAIRQSWPFARGGGPLLEEDRRCQGVRGSANGCAGV